MNSKNRKVRKRMLAMLLASATLLSGISINYFSQKDGSTEIVAVNQDMEIDSTELISEPVQLAMSAGDSGNSEIVETGSREVAAVSGFSAGSVATDNETEEQSAKAEDTVKEVQEESNIADSIVNAYESQPQAAAPAEDSVEEAAADTQNNENSRIVADDEPRFSEILADELTTDDDVVDFIVVLDKDPLLDVFSADEVKENTEAVAAYRAEQEQMIDALRAELKAAFGEEEGFSPGYDYTMSSTGMSVRTKFGNQEAIEKMANVKKVYVSPTFQVSTEPTNVDMYTNNASGMIGGKQLNETGFTGKGMKVAIIDTGIVVDHPSFGKMSDDKLTADSMTKEFVNEIWDSLNAGKSTHLRNASYYNNKLPFIFNYYGRNFDVSHETASHDHGTHVAGIVAANKIDTTEVVGIAPDAQLIVMQVFSTSGGAEWSTIMAALEDCIPLDVDAANLSLGMPAGFTNSLPELEAVLDRFEDTGIQVVIAGGNDTNNAYMNLTGTDMSKSRDVDNGLIGTPATAPIALAVASAENNGADLPYFTVGEDQIGFSDSATTMATNFLERFEEDELEFVVIDGVGDPGDYGTTDVTDKVVVVKRGTISFQEKQANAKAKGAKALIVYNNVAGSFSMAISDGEGNIPCVAISKTDGEKLVALREGTLTVCRSGQKIHVAVPTAMSDFSSWGVTPDMKLKPEITGVGGNIYSTRDPYIGGSNYGNMSGTSMASPQVAGAITVLTQYLRATYNRANTPVYTDQQLRQIAANLLMSTASQIEEGETVYSPRYQGAGLVDLTSATTAGAYFSNPEAYDTRPKGEMGDDDERKGEFSFPFTITNLDNKVKTYTFDSIVLTPDVDGEFMTNTTRALKAKVEVYNGSNKATQIQVPANGKVELTAKLKLDTLDKSFITTNFENGTYVEGYLYAKTGTNENETLSMPFLGFYGDWSAAPVFDGRGEEASLYDAQIITTKTTLGKNPYLPNGKGGDQYNAISNTNEIQEIVLGLMRNAKIVRQRVVSEDGNTEYFSLEEKNITKTYYSTTYGMIIPYNLFDYNEEIYIWDGTNQGAPLSDGTVAIYKIEACLDDGDNEVDSTFEFKVTMDNQDPVISNQAELNTTALTKDTENGTVKIRLDMSENHYIAAVIFEALDGTILGKFQPEVGESAGQNISQEFDVTGYGTDFRIIVADYACNETEVEVSLDLSGMPTVHPEPKPLEAGRIYGNETYSGGLVSIGWFSAEKDGFKDLKNEAFDAANKTYSGEYINGYVIAQRASDGALMMLTPYNTYWNTKVIWKQEGNVGSAGFKVLYDMALDYSTNKLYATGWLYQGDENGDSKDDGYNALFEIKLGDTITVDVVERFTGLNSGVDALTLGCTTDGRLYTITTEGDLYEIDKNTAALTKKGQTSFVDMPNYSGVNVIQSMCYDHNTNQMYWYAHSQTYHAGTYLNVGQLYTVNLDNGECTPVGGNGTAGYTSLFIPATGKTSDIFEARVDATNFELSPSEVKMAQGQTRRITVDWKPWNALPGTVNWSTGDEEVATVTQNGIVKAEGTGTTTITAEATLGTETVTKTISVSVVDSADALYGFVIKDYNGKMPDSSWITYSDRDIKNPKQIVGGGGLVQGGTYYEGHVYYVVAEQEFMSPITHTYFYKSVVTQDKDDPSKTKIGSPTLIKKTENIELGNLSFDYSTGRMYAVDYTNGGLCTIDIETGGVDRIGVFTGELGAAIMPAMCVTAEGTIIGSDMYGNLYTVNPDTMEARQFASIGKDTWYYAAMGYDHDTGNIYWNPCTGFGSNESELYLVKFDEINPESSEIINLGGVGGDDGMEQTAIFTIPVNEPETQYIQATKIEFTNNNGNELLGLVGGTMQLTTKTEPVRPSTYPREWSSDNEAVVSVDDYGLMSFHSVGEATLTVKVRNKGIKTPPECTDTIKVVVHEAAGEMVAFLASDEGASTYFDFWIDIKDYDLVTSRVGTSMIGTYSLRTGEYYDGYLYAYNDADKLYRINSKNYEDYVTIADDGMENDRVISMAFDYSTGTMYGVTMYAGMGGHGKLVKINLGTGAVTEVQQLAQNISAIAIDKNGQMYGVGSSEIYATTYLYKIDKETGACEQLQSVPHPRGGEGGVDWTGETYGSERMYSSQMTYDYETDRLYLNASIRHKTFASHSYGMYLIQLEGDGESRGVDFIANLGMPALALNSTKIGEMYLGLLCYVPDEDTVTGDVVTGLLLNRETARVMKGETTPLTVTVSPSKATNKEVTWSSADESIATVDAQGVITGVSAGEVEIVATSVGNPNVTASCKVTVLESTPGATAYAVSAKQEALIQFDPEVPASTAERIAVLSGGRKIVGMDMIDDNNLYYLVDEGIWPVLYHYNLKTKTSTLKGQLQVFIGGPSDMAYDPDLDLIYVVSGFYIFQFEERRLQAGELNGYGMYLDSTKRSEIPLSHMHAITYKDGKVYFLMGDNGATLYKTDDVFSEIEKVRDVAVNTVSGRCEFAYDSENEKFYLTDAGDRLYSFEEDSESPVVAIDIVGKGWDINGMAINPSGAPEMEPLPEIPDKPLDPEDPDPVDPEVPEINPSDIVTEEVVQGGTVDLTDNIKNLPEGARIEVLENVSSAEVGNFTGKVKVIFANGTSREVSIPVIVTAAPEPKPWPFTDVKEDGQWKHVNVKYVWENNIMQGIANTTLFQPDHPLTRGMFATVLYRMAGSPDVEFRNEFSDVTDPNKYYSKPILWAKDQKIVEGFTDGSFGAEENITREQIAKMLFLYAEYEGYDVASRADLADFTDDETVNSWATEYVKWAVATKMISGKPNGDGTYRIAPGEDATRAECAKMLTEFLKHYRDTQN